MKNEPVKIQIRVDNYLPAEMIIEKLSFSSNILLESNLEEKYHVPGQTTRTLTVDCIPIEAGTLKIQGLTA